MGAERRQAIHHHADEVETVEFIHHHPPSDPNRIDNGPPPDLRHAKTAGKEHGRIETPQIDATAEVVPYLDWPGWAQVARLTQTREIGGKASGETVYLIASLPIAEASPERLLALNRVPTGARALRRPQHSPRHQPP